MGVSLVTTYPSVISTAFITGYNVFPNTNPTFMAYTFWLGGRIEGAVSKCLRRQRPGSHTPTLDEYREVMKTVCHESWPSPWPARTLTIAAGNPGLFADHIKDAIKLQDLGRQSNLETAAYTHREFVHAWHHEKPETFAQTCKAWFEEGKVAEGFKKLCSQKLYVRAGEEAGRSSIYFATKDTTSWTTSMVSLHEHVRLSVILPLRCRRQLHLAESLARTPIQKNTYPCLRILPLSCVSVPTIP